MDKGYVQIYTGNGKGKTTCALGLALRAVGSGKRVYIGQFMKDGDYSEIKAIAQCLDAVTVEQYGAGLGFVTKSTVSQAHICAAKAGLEKAQSALTSGTYDLVILDEIHVAVFFGMLQEQDLLRVIQNKPEGVELVLTGRYATEAVMQAADLVTEMREIKHYAQQGVAARVGIEM